MYEEDGLFEKSGSFIIVATFIRKCNFMGKVPKDAPIDREDLFNAFCKKFKAKIRQRSINPNTGNEVLLVTGKISKAYLKEVFKRV